MSDHQEIRVEILRDTDQGSAHEAEAILRAARSKAYSLLRTWRSRFTSEELISKTYTPQKGETISVNSSQPEHVHIELTREDHTRALYDLDGSRPDDDALQAAEYGANGDDVPLTGDDALHFDGLSQLLYLCDRIEIEG